MRRALFYVSGPGWTNAPALAGYDFTVALEMTLPWLSILNYTFLQFVQKDLVIVPRLQILCSLGLYAAYDLCPDPQPVGDIALRQAGALSPGGKRRAGGVPRRGWRHQGSVYLPRHVPLQASHRLPLALVLGDPPGDVLRGPLVAAHPADHDAVQRAVRLTVAAPVVFSLCLTVLPLDASMGLAPQSIVNVTSSTSRYRQSDEGGTATPA